MPPVVIDAIDHFVLTVADVDATCLFYGRVLGLETVTFAGGRKGLAAGAQKINLHPVAADFPERAGVPTPGAGDFCLLTRTPLADVVRHLALQGIAIESGPIAKTGARSALMSVYFRDPDGNLVEVANEVDG